jgi:hypothetical protein
LQAYFAYEKVEASAAVVVYDFDAPSRFTQRAGQTVFVLFDYAQVSRFTLSCHFSTFSPLDVLSPLSFCDGVVDQLLQFYLFYLFECAGP